VVARAWTAMGSQGRQRWVRKRHGSSALVVNGLREVIGGGHAALRRNGSACATGSLRGHDLVVIPAFGFDLQSRGAVQATKAAATAQMSRVPSMQTRIGSASKRVCA